MTRPHETLALLFSLAILLLARNGLLRAEEEAPSRPNILIIFTDDQGYADLGCYRRSFAVPITPPCGPQQRSCALLILILSICLASIPHV